MFTYTLQVLNDFLNFDYEYTESLLAIQDDVILTVDNDVASRFSEENHSKTIEGKIESKSKQTSSRNTINERLREFLSDSLMMSRKKSTSRALFLENQRSEMIEYHDDFDVFIDDDLLK